MAGQIDEALFEEEWYLTAYPDVAEAVRRGLQSSGRAHYFSHGFREARRPTPPTQKYRLAVCAIVKDEAPYVLEWIAYHWAVGVEHFYVYDNDSVDGTSIILNKLQQLGFVTRIAWPNRLQVVVDSGIGPQVPAYNHFLQFSYETKWVAYIDIDEFLVPRETIDLREWLSRCSQHAVGVNWRMFGSSGLARYDNRLVIERFVRRANDDFPPNRHVKTLAIAREVKNANTHIAYLKRGDLVDVSGARIDLARNGVHDYCAVGDLQINHYFTRSKEEWARKREKGRVSKSVSDKERFRSQDEFDFYDRNEVTDRSALRFADDTRKNLAAIEQLMRPLRASAG